mgnify:CR=1 FL=1
MKVFLADDHPIFRSGLQFLLETSFDKINVSSFENGSLLLDKLESEIPDIVIADIDMPGMNGLELCKEICEKKPGTKVIMLTMYNDHEMLKHGMVMYDALYAWCRSLTGETHNWPPTRWCRRICGGINLTACCV